MFDQFCSKFLANLRSLHIPLVNGCSERFLNTLTQSEHKKANFLKWSIIFTTPFFSSSL